MTKLPRLTRQEISLTTGMPEGTEFERNNGFSGWAIVSYPSWSWDGYIYRPVAPEGWKHTGRFEIPKKEEWFLDWGTGIAFYNGSFKNRHWILEKDTPEEEPEEMAYEIRKGNGAVHDNYWILPIELKKPIMVNELPGLVIDGRAFDRYEWPHHSPLGFSKHIFHAREGKLPTHAIFRRPDKED